MERISPEVEKLILEKAYVPEHVIPLMVGVSRAEPFYSEGYLFFAKEDWLIFIGYPLENDFLPETFSAALDKVLKKFQPSSASFIAPEIPGPYRQFPQQTEKDEYYKLDLRGYEIPRELKRNLRRALQEFTVERTRFMSSEHANLIREFLEEKNPSARVQELYLRMPAYVPYSPSSLVLNARDKEKNLSAFYVLELGAQKFATYVVGCFSQKTYLPHASDLLFYEMIKIATEAKKEYIHLGLGVNEGIKRFKKKWGGIPFLPYELCELRRKPPGPFSWLQALQNRL